jgi:hypothetical protein
MRTAWLNSSEALRLRMVNPTQVAPTDPEAEMPPYMESLLAHLRLLVGVPFDYLVADSRLLPMESIRFFYLDRSWTDRLVDGAIAVGKIGTREQAHHQAHSPAVQQQLDQSERIVRTLQMGGPFGDLKQSNDQNQQPGDIITGFLLRSAAVAWWPHMDVRAYGEDILEPFDAAASIPKQLLTLRLELLSPSVMLALFQGIPKLVILEEPHHAMQFGVHAQAGGFGIFLRTADGHQILDTNAPPNPVSIPVPVRAANNRVIAVWDLRHQLKLARPQHTASNGNPLMPDQTGSAGFAVEALQPPWRQRFEGTEDSGECGLKRQTGNAGFVSTVAVAGRVTASETTKNLQDLLAQK